MDLFSEPTPFVEALKTLVAKKVTPSGMSAADWKQTSASVRNLSFFSARNEMEGSLDFIKQTVQSVVDPSQEEREGQEQTTTVGFNPATARAAIIKDFRDRGYQADPEDEGTIKDLASPTRVDLVVKTNVGLANGAGHYIQGNANQDVVDLWPAYELLPFDSSRVPRGEKETKDGLEPDPENGWPARFRAAAEEAGDEDALRVLDATGRMVALKASGTWQALGDGAGGYEDTLGNPFTPFAFNSTRQLEEVSREECEDMGLLKPGQKVEAAPLDFAKLFDLEGAG